MSRNRIIHNVQDVFVGSTPSETDTLITGVAGHQVLKRLNRIQSFNYGIDIPKEDKYTLGQSKPFSRKMNAPPTVTFSLSYYLDGVNNEDRIGLNTDNENRKSSDKTKSLFYDMVENNGADDKRNFYLVVNNGTDDVHGQHVDLPHTKLANGTFTKNDVIDPNSPNYSVVAFQNSYLTNYNISVEAGQLPNVDLSYVADNMVGYVSGSGINIPYLDSKKGEVTDGAEAKEFIIPKHFDRSTNNKNLIDDDFLLRDGYVNVKINKVGVSGVSGIYDDSIRSCSISCSLDRDTISYVGQKMISDRLIQFPVSAELQLDTIVKENISGSFIDDINEEEDYNITVDFKYHSKGMIDDGYVDIFTFSGAKFDGINYNNSIGSNKTASLKFSTVTDFENHTAGVFLSGKVSSALVDLELNNGDDLTDNDNNTVLALPVYLQY